MSEIIVTPFVDVMLVLLIVFMVTAPLLTVGIKVDLPKVKATALTDIKDPIEVTVKLDGVVYIGETKVEVDILIPRLNATSMWDGSFKPHNFISIIISIQEVKVYRLFLNLIVFSIS